MAKKKYIVGLSYTSGVNKKRLDTDKKQVTHDVFFEIIRVALRAKYLTLLYDPNEVLEVYLDKLETDVSTEIAELKITLEKGLTTLTVGNLYFEVQC